MKKTLLLLIACCATQLLLAVNCKIQHLEPLHWWVGMQNTELQLCVHGQDMGACEAAINYPGVTITKQVKTDNPNFLFVYLNIDPTTKPGSFKINFTKNGKKYTSCKYELKARKENAAQKNSFGPSDAVYLLMPDRFANGNEKNDQVKGYIQGVNRSNLGERHGGDLEGVISKVPYIADLGCTALWITPFFDNNDIHYSYHHYATSDYFKVDPRLGTNNDYKRLADSCHVHGLKLILDVVPNHCGSAHWWSKDKPAKDWFHEWPQYTGSNYRMTAWTDPHASDIDKTILEKGWFSGNMPDLNLENPELFTYLSQVYIWWIEYAGVDGLRVDTYPYNDIKLASQFIKRFIDEYPTINIVGECWVKSPLEIAYYQAGNNNKDGFNSNLPSVMDFVLKDHLQAAFNEQDSWDFGTSRFYAHYAQDFAYPDVNNVMNFLDNHDIDRFSVAVKRDVNKFNMGVAHLLTTRGYPQIYAGTEIMIDGIWGNYEGHRFDFPGGWKADQRNAFTAEGRTDEENNVFNYMRSLLQFRKNATALHTGKMKQFIPYDGIYVFARYNDNQTVMVITNNNNQEKQISLDRYKEVFGQYTKAIEVTTGKEYALTKLVSIPGKSCLVLDLKP